MSIQTHKEFDDYADDFRHDFPISAVPRDPAEYLPNTHFLDMKRDRNIGGDVIRGCIEEGEVHEAEEDNRYRFLWTHPTTLQTYSLIVELQEVAFCDEFEKHECVTVYRFQH